MTRNPLIWAFTLLIVVVSVICWRVGDLVLLQRGTSAAIGWNLRTATWNLAAAAYEADQAAAALNDQKHGLRQTLYNINALTAQAARTMTSVHTMAQDEHRQQSAAADLLVADLKALGTLVANADENINGKDGALPAVTLGLKTLTGTMDSTATDLHSLAAASTTTMAAAGKAMGDPNIQVIVKGLADTSTEAAGATKDLHAMTTKAEAKLFPPPQKLTFKQKVVAGLEFFPRFVIAWLKAGAPGI